MNRYGSIWNLAFRPFFLFASVFSVLAMSIWTLLYSDILRLSLNMPPLLWHAHEMVFGFSTAIIAGFVLTASQNWSGIRGINGFKLKLITLVWLIARILPLLFKKETVAIAVIDLSFIPITGLFLWPYLQDKDLKIERIFFVFFSLMFCGNTLVHSELLGITQATALTGIHLGLYTIILIIIFMGGRVIPFFTESTVSKMQPKTFRGIEILAHASAVLFFVLEVFFQDSTLTPPAGFFAFSIHLIRLWGWQVPRIRRVPLLWILHSSYFWISLGFLMSALASLGLIPKPIAIHTFTVGGIGAIIYGMIARVSLGHTGRRLLPQRSVVVGFYLLNFSAVFRVLLPLFFPLFSTAFVKFSGLLWIISFVIFSIVYFPILTRPRIDQRPG